MNVQTLAAAAFMAAAAFTPASAASIDLAALGLVKGASLAQSDAVTVSVDVTFDSFDAFVFDADFEGSVLGTPSTGTGFLGLFQPIDFDGDLIDFDIDVAGGSAAGLFFDSMTATYILAELTLPSAFTADLFITDASAEIFAVAPIPLPAALPLTLAGLGALVVAGRRRTA